MSDLVLQLQDTEVSMVPVSRSALLKKQMPGLDALRGLAVLGVVAYHGCSWFLPQFVTLSPAVQQLASATKPGWLGVNLFFILSGFLITGILIDTRSRSNYWQSFYVRRMLRILPLYLVTLGVATWVLGLYPRYILLCILNGANLHQFIPHMGPSYDPFWSLAVEEQFYLIWPLLVLRVSRRTLTILCLILIVLCPLLRALSVGTFPWLGNAYSTTWLVSDNLAWGSLVAIFLRSPHASIAAVKIRMAGLCAGGLALLALFQMLHIVTRKTPVGAALQIMPFLLIFTFLLLLALRYGDNQHVIRWTKPLRFFGFISYGLYLLHLFLFYAYDKLLPGFVKSPDHLTMKFVLARFVIVVAVASLTCFLSRHYFEEKFLLLKDRLVPYAA